MQPVESLFCQDLHRPGSDYITTQGWWKCFWSGEIDNNVLEYKPVLNVNMNPISLVVVCGAPP